MNYSQDYIQALFEQTLKELRDIFDQIEAAARTNQRKVLEAFWAERVGTSDFSGTTGYGLDDEGRDKLERIYASVFGAEAGLVRPQIISGTHALRLGLFGMLRPGDEVLFASGKPYDTLEGVVGIRKTPGSLAEWGISHRIIQLNEAGELDIPAILAGISSQTKVVMFQRSRGYSLRKALTIDVLEAAIAKVKSHAPHVIVAVDNCYGEFVDTLEPTNIGADLVMGSLIKNPGAGLAPTGGYVVGRQDLVAAAAAQLTAPGLGAEMGPSHDFLRILYQSLFMAPHVVSQAVKGSVFAARIFEKLGLDVSPRWTDKRSDLILSVALKTRENLLAFCQAVQASAPVDSYVIPQAAPMAGYESEVVMAAGSFVQGGSLDLSADAPMREPFVAYFQGGLTFEHVYLALGKIVMSLDISS